MARRRKWRDAVEMIEGEMAERNVPLGAWAGSAVIAAVGRARQWEKALELLHRIDKPNAACFTAAAGACGRCNEGEAALSLLDEMDALGVVPDSRALQTVAWAAGRGSGWTASLATLRRLRADGYAVDAADFLGVALAVCEDDDAIYSMLRSAKDEGIDVDPLTFYSAVLQGWQGTSAAPHIIAASMLRGLASGDLPLTSDLRAWNLLCEVALEDIDDDILEGEEEDEEEANASVEEPDWQALQAWLDDDGDGKAAADAEEAHEDEEDDEVLQLIDAAYSKAIEEGIVRHWATDLRAFDNLDDEMLDEMLDNLDDDEPAVVLDLHGFSVSLARAAMRHVLIAELLDKGIDHAGPESDIVVITGRGRGSGDEGAVLGPAVVRMLREEAEPPIEAHSVRGNEGRLRIKRASLEKWLEANRAEYRE